MSVQYSGDKITFADGSIIASGWSGFKNRIINGAMMIDQRNAGASVTPTVDTYNLDRWSSSIAQASKLSFQRSTTAPTGFVNSLLSTVVSAVASPAAGDYFGYFQRIEGYNCADLAWGTASAQPITVSFWVRSSVTGTFSVNVHNLSGPRSYVTTYTVNSANTFEYKTVTIQGDTTGTWPTDNSTGLTLYFTLGTGTTYGGATANTWNSSLKLATTGSTNLLATAGATFYITGVQLEKGSTATSFDYRPYGTELALCERYYQKCGVWSGCANTSTNWLGIVPIGTPMRITPSVSATGPVNISNFYTADPVQSSFSAAILNNDLSGKSLCIWLYNFSGLTGGAYYAGNRSPGGNTNYLLLSAEL